MGMYSVSHLKSITKNGTTIWEAGFELVFDHPTKNEAKKITAKLKSISFSNKHYTNNWVKQFEKRT